MKKNRVTAVSSADHMQIICKMIQADKHASNFTRIFYRPDAVPNAQQTA